MTHIVVLLYYFGFFLGGGLVKVLKVAKSVRTMQHVNAAASHVVVPKFQFLQNAKLKNTP